MLSIANQIKWISSSGGPLILMDRSLSSNWLGDSAHDSHPYLDLVSDYDRACQVEDYLALIDVDKSKALVFGDLPSQTTKVSADSDLILLARWIWGENEDDIKHALQEFNVSQSWSDTGLSIQLKTHELIVFDSVFPGNEVENSIDIKTEPGTFNVYYVSYEPNEKTNLFMIKLERKYM